MKRGITIFFVSFVGICIMLVITMDVYSVVYEQQNPAVTDELFLNKIPIALSGWGWDSSDIYRPIKSGVSIDYSIEINASVITSSVGIYFIEIDDVETLSMVSDPDNYTVWLETNTDKWDGGIIKSRSSLRSVQTGTIKPTKSGEYTILGINVFQVISFRVVLVYQINNLFNLVSNTFVDIAKSSFAIIIPFATILLVIDRVITLTRKEPRNEPSKKSKN